MGARGFKSKAAQEAKPVVVLGGFKRRHDPPDDLTEPQKAIWRETITSEAEELFSTAATRAMLKDYCRHRADADRLSETINAFKTEWLRQAEGMKRYRELSRERGEEAYRAARMATKLRVTNQSRYTPKTAGTAARNAGKGPMPWDFDGEEADDED